MTMVKTAIALLIAAVMLVACATGFHPHLPHRCRRAEVA